MLVDAQEYFCALERALSQAQRSITILGWDFDGRIALCPDAEGGGEPLGRLLLRLAEERPQLEIRILVWSVAIAHAPGASLPLLFGADWDEHPRITVRLDTEHPIYAAHHQKVVCIDEAIAFAGGMDLTVCRWDTCAHEPCNDLRITPDGKSYAPVHDLQVVINGEAARHLSALTHERWRRATGERLPPPIEQAERWIDAVQPDFTDVGVAIARTSPPWAGEPAVEEVAVLTLDLIRAARRAIYIEAQYLTCRKLRNALAERLAEPDGPEIVAVVARAGEGVIERLVMGKNRDRLVRWLRRRDPYDRLRVFHPASGCGTDAECEILVHAKLMIVDDTLLRVGSANLNNRSRGLDTECDLVIEAQDEATRAGIRRLRARLMAEHLGSEPKIVERAIADAGGSLIRAIARLAGGKRRLHEFKAMHETKGPTRPIFGTALFDPPQPMRLHQLFRARRRKPAAKRSPEARVAAASAVLAPGLGTRAR